MKIQLGKHRFGTLAISFGIVFLVLVIWKHKQIYQYIAAKAGNVLDPKMVTPGYLDLGTGKENKFGETDTGQQGFDYAKPNQINPKTDPDYCPPGYDKSFRKLASGKQTISCIKNKTAQTSRGWKTSSGSIYQSA